MIIQMLIMLSKHMSDDQVIEQLRDAIAEYDRGGGQKLNNK